MEPKPDIKEPGPFTWLIEQTDGRASRLLALAVVLSYVSWTAALIVAIILSLLCDVRAGMPAAGVISMLPISFICGWFMDMGSTRAARRLTWMWRLWSVLLFYLLIRLLQHAPELTGTPVQFVGAVAISLGVMGATQWALILFLDDRYANVTWPFLGALPMSVSYLVALFTTDVSTWQFFLAPAWLILLAMILLYTAIFLRGLHLFYPGYTNLAFPAWIFVLSMALMFVFAVTATKTVIKIPNSPPSVGCPE